jgi:hypothetical protein
MTDFGADSAFGASTIKVKEHYGIDVPASAIRLVVQKHAQGMANYKGKKADREEVIISETDESMIPIVERAKI